ncbi:MAG: NTP transferase domain-containing protein [Clostridia bacterium]|nr:NTP transferase domain-containing protein [Clostridia bacterium]
MSAELVVMAAGMGSRFGGLKQAAPVGPNGEMIIDYSVADAVKAGFKKAVFIIRKDIEKDFRAACGKRIEGIVDVEYVYQEKDDLPQGFTLPEGRLKPWGTGQAILSAADVVKNPFLVINADDYYGQSVYKTMYDYLANNDGMCMAGYKLGNTLSENGTVSRGVCKVENGYLKSLDEMTDIPFDTDIPKDTPVSMNMWGLDLGIFDYLKKEFNLFLEENINEPKKEFLLPLIINKRVNETGMQVKVLPTDEQWYGVTYSEDLPAVKKAIADLNAKGLY